MGNDKLQSLLPESYPSLLRELKLRIQSSQSAAVLAVNQELLTLYFDVGKMIVQRQESEHWGRNVVERLSNDLKVELSDLRGFSPSNMWRMRAFFLAWREQGEKLAQPVREIPWGHNVVLIEKVKSPEIRLWYASKAIANGWSRAALTVQIESRLHERQGQALSNFDKTLPKSQSDIAQETLKDPYIFDFLNLSEKATERDLESALLENISRFLLELGTGFAFIGRQYHLSVEGDDFYIDLLFYHIHLRSYVVIDLKMGKFKPEYSGKMNFYLAVVDAELRKGGDSPSIGLILCKDKKRMIVEYALSETNRPVGVAKWLLTRELPDKLKGELPDIQDIEDAIKTS